MTEAAEIKLVLEKKGLNYKLKDHNIGDNGEETFTFVDALKQTLISGRVIRTFNEGEIYHWPLLNHENISPLIDVLFIRDDYHVCLTIDQEITLKDIVHDEDFVYNPRCFERKRSYARGIFSGLSYLHGKSLCLMNLSDSNIVISKLYDKAVITNFSCLVCAKKTNKSKMKVPEVYRAPESEKGDFDPIAAEIWASGILMLEMFLAHMVPWAVIDYKPKRIMDIVNKLSLEFLQAANTGSVVSSLDLAKFKTFLKCFFKQVPVARITARYASIASFLRPKFQDVDLQVNTTHEDLHIMDGERTQVEDTKLSTNVEIEFKRLLSKEGYSLKRESENDYLNIPSPFVYESNDSIAAPETADEHKKATKSCQTVETWTNKDIESDYTCYQSKSLTFLKVNPKGSSIGDNDFNTQTCLNKMSSFSQVETSPVEISDTSDLQNGDLSHLFDENILVDELGGSKEKDLAPLMDSASEAIKIGSATKIISKYDCCEHSCFSRMDLCRMPVSRGLPKRKETSKSDIQKIVKKILLLKKCQTSLQKQLRIFISEEFAYKQRKLFNEYEHMLHQEILRLRAVLKRQCELDEQNMRVNSKLRYMGAQRGSLPPFQKSNSILFEDVLEAEKLRDSMKDLCIAKSNQSGKLENKIAPNIRLGKNYSYCRAIENSENVWEFYKQAHENKNQEHELKSVELNDSTENLIEAVSELNIKTAVVRGNVRNKSKLSKVKTRRKAECVEQEDSRCRSKKTGRSKTGKSVKNDKDNKEKKRKKASKHAERQSMKKNESCKQAAEFRRPFFFGLCPGGKIETSEPNLENLCETCKLTYNIM